MVKATVTTGAKPHGQQQLTLDIGVERTVMGKRCRPRSFGEVQRCYPLYFVPHTQYSCSWASLTDQLVRKFKERFGTSSTMKARLQEEVRLVEIAQGTRVRYTEMGVFSAVAGNQ